MKRMVVANEVFGSTPLECGTGTRVVGRVASAVFVAAGVLLSGSGIAAAHVPASAPNAAPGSYTVVTLRVPNESETAGTVGLEVTLPQDHPLAEVRIETTPGWDVTLRRMASPTPLDNGRGGKLSELESAVTFAARQGVSIAPGEFAEFRLLLGPPPNVRELTLPTTATTAWFPGSSAAPTAPNPTSPHR
jgi:hypothetical protein